MKTLVILAAGMGSRFGGLKQIEPIGPNGEFIIDYSIYDAKRCGFEKVIFIIKEENLEIFEETIGKRIKPYINVEYAFQKLEDIPEGYQIPNREKPLGTGHAIYCARHLIKDNFALMNADDFYGYGGIKAVSDFLDTDLNKEGKENYALVGYKLKNTITDNGSVKRGVCEIKDGKLVGLDESLVEKEDNILIKTSFKTNKKEQVKDGTLVSMNLIALTILTLENISEEIAEREMTITIIGDTIPAETAASPKTIAPKIEIAVPDKCGIRISLSRNISKTSVSPRASTIAGKGTPSL